MQKQNNDTRLPQLICEVKRDMMKANVPFSNTVPIVINNRLTNTLGRCHIHRTAGAIKIDIAQIVMNCPDDTEIKNVICHELIHSARVCLTCGHNGMWQSLADKMNASGQNYTITPVEKRDVFTQYNHPNHKFRIQCPHCGLSQAFTRETKIVTTIKEGNGGRIRCPQCKNYGFELVDIK